MARKEKKLNVKFLDVVFIIILAISIQFVLKSNSIWGYVQFAVIYIIFIDYWLETNTSKSKKRTEEYEIFLDFGIMVLIFTSIYLAVIESYAFYIAFAFFFLIDAISTYLEYKVMKEVVWILWKKMWVANDIVMCIVLSVLGVLVQENILSNMIAFIVVSGLYFFLRFYVAYKTKIKFTYIK